MLPTQITYNTVRPKGWYTKFKQWPIEPLSSNMYWKPTQIVRFQLQQTSGVMDPYRSHFVIHVSTPPVEQMPVGGNQLDISTFSLTSQLVISSKNVQIERISEYDTLGAYLVDTGFSQMVCENRQSQGFGYHQMQTTLPTTKRTYGTQSLWVEGSGSQLKPVIESIPNPGFIPTKVITPNILQTYGGSSNLIPQLTRHRANSMVGSHYTSTNYLNIPSATGKTTTTSTEQILQEQSRFMNMRAQYDQPTVLMNYIDTPTSFKHNAPMLRDRPIDWTTKGGIKPGTSYALQWNQEQIATRFQGGQYINTSVPNITSIFGYDKAFSSKFSVGAFQPMISPTIPQTQFAYGKSLLHPIPISQRRFQAPVLSGILGVLIPPDQYKLLPLAAFSDLLMQMTLSQFAMFSTGYNDVHQFDIQGMQNPVKRNYVITRIYYNLHIYQWPANQIASYITQSLTKQIGITGISWALSAQYQIPTGQHARNNWPVNVNAQSLCQIVCIFLSNHYMRYPFCRKQFRLSNNITSMQIKFNTDYHPSQPIMGNAGNPDQVDKSGTNAQFMHLMLTSGDRLFVTNMPQGRINKYNFAMNDRPYDPTNQKPLYQPEMFENKNYRWHQKSINGDTAMGQPWFHENRAIGKAAFVYSFEPFAHSKQYMVGIDTRSSRPFDVIFDVAPTNYYPHDETLYIFTRQNIGILYGNGYVKVVGR